MRCVASLSKCSTEYRDTHKSSGAGNTWGVWGIRQTGYWLLGEDPDDLGKRNSERSQKVPGEPRFCAPWRRLGNTVGISGRRDVDLVWKFSGRKPSLSGAMSRFLNVLRSWLVMVAITATGNTLQSFRDHAFLHEKLYTGQPGLALPSCVGFFLRLASFMVPKVVQQFQAHIPTMSHLEK
uniref:Uncharacterized protein n=1 Tax=Equus caballus TaxID=9796 RepID=A0A9L0S453_HORSE